MGALKGEMMGLKIFFDGKLVNKEEAVVSVFDHGLLYGDGVFEGIRSYGSLVFKLAEHVDRLFESAHTLMLKIPMTKAETKGEMQLNVWSLGKIDPALLKGVGGK